MLAAPAAPRSVDRTGRTGDESRLTFAVPEYSEIESETNPDWVESLQGWPFDRSCAAPFALGPATLGTRRAP